MNTLRRASPLVACFLGALHACSFAPWDLPWLQVLALSALFALGARAQSARRAALLGFAFGMGWFGVGVSWVYISMHVYGLMPAVLAGAATAAFCAYLAIYPALALGIAHRLFPNITWRLAVGLPAFWMIAEWLRGSAFTGFPWLAGGYAHTDGPLAGWAPTLGMYGITLMAALLAGAISLLMFPRRLPTRRYGWAAAVCVVVLAGGWFGRTQSWTAPTGSPINVRLVQANVPQNLKFEPDGIARAFSTHLQLMQQGQAESLDLVALPESIFPVPMQYVPPSYLQTFRDFAQQRKAAVIFGVFLEEPRGHYFNSAVAYLSNESPDDANLRRYSKRHLVPFGEFIPPGFRWFVDLMKMPIGDQRRGATAQPLALRGQQVAVNICYEDLFGAEIIDAWHTGGPSPTLMLNISNLAWFNDSLALPQHLQISRMRVLETQHPMLRATNTGASAIIDARGEVVAQLPYLTAGALDGTVQGYEGRTPFIRYGNWPALLLAGLLILVALLKRSDR